MGARVAHSADAEEACGAVCGSGGSRGAEARLLALPLEGRRSPVSRFATLLGARPDARGPAE
eukprot:3517970-Heterocapsa_arctica.AAC.1